MKRLLAIGTPLALCCLFPLAAHCQQLTGTIGLGSADVTFNGIDGYDENNVDYVPPEDPLDLPDYDPGDEAGSSLSTVGDFNGDGFDDILIGARGAQPNGNSRAGEAYLIYGRGNAATLSGAFDLSAADVTFNGLNVRDYTGTVATAGDFNGDGLSDLLIGASGADPDGKLEAGSAYLVYGRSGGSTLTGTFDLAMADVTFNGASAFDGVGRVISSAGDVNGDGLDDLLFGAQSSGPDEAGQTYLVYGRGDAETLSGAFDLANADVTFDGINFNDQAGESVASAGDFNGDGLGDILIGAGQNGPDGTIYLIYGRSGDETLSGAFDLATADVMFNGTDLRNTSNFPLSSGDFNGDGLGDILIGAYLSGEPGPDGEGGQAHLIYGRGGEEELLGAYDVDNADVTFNGIGFRDRAGSDVSSAGDVDGDGIDDILVAAMEADPDGRIRAGQTYLIYGRGGTAVLLGDIDLADADATFDGIDAKDYSGTSVSSAGDFNGDGLTDILIGASHGDPNDKLGSGEIYLIYGQLASADANGDGKIDGLDFLVWAQNYGNDPALDLPGSPANGDFNGDGVVDGLDYVIWTEDFGQGPSDVTIIPEPGSFSLLSLALASFTLRRRRH